MQSPKSQIRILIITELKKQQSIEITKSVIDILHNTTVIPLSLFTQDPKLFEHTNLYKASETQFDYIISIGENGTMMRALRILANRNTVPLLSISDGNEPIMSSYSFCETDDVLKSFIKAIEEDKLKIMHTLQFDYFERNNSTKKSSFSCQLQIHRDMRKSVLKLKLYAKIQGKDYLHLANIWGDGLIISTPLGSLGKNINLSGPIAYKSLDSITIVPINPLSLKFRPIILPATAQILIEVQQNSRSPGQIFADGQMICQNLSIGQQILLKKSNQSSKLVKGLSKKSTDQQWVSCLRQVLNWGEAFSDHQKQQHIKNPKL